jgi:hypothetical protein
MEPLVPTPARISMPCHNSFILPPSCFPCTPIMVRPDLWHCSLSPSGAPPPPPPPPHPARPPSQGVGVVLFDSSDHALAVVSKLSGTMADGRRLEMALMSPENHMSFTGTRVSAWVCGVCGCV